MAVRKLNFKKMLKPLVALLILLPFVPQTAEAYSYSFNIAASVTGPKHFGVCHDATVKTTVSAKTINANGQTATTSANQASYNVRVGSATSPLFKANGVSATKTVGKLKKGTYSTTVTKQSHQYSRIIGSGKHSLH